MLYKSGLPYHYLKIYFSAGIGRTGTLIALDILMEQAHRKRAIDVANTVIKIRKDRGKMVQTEVR